MAHDDTHEELLQEMLAGDLATDAAARSRLEGCAECVRRWRELSDVVAAIDGADRERREVLFEAAVVRAVSGSERVAATLREQRGATFAVRPGTRRGPARWNLVLLAAALLVAGFFVVRALAPDPADDARIPDVPLGGKGVEFREDYATLSAGATISWTHPSGRERGPFRVVLTWKDGDGKPMSKRIGVEATEWNPSAEELEDLPANVFLQLVLVDEFAPDKPLLSSPRIPLTVSR